MVPYRQSQGNRRPHSGSRRMVHGHVGKRRPIVAHLHICIIIKFPSWRLKNLFIIIVSELHFLNCQSYHSPFHQRETATVSGVLTRRMHESQHA